MVKKSKKETTLEKRNRRRHRLKKITKWHAHLTAYFLIFYLIASLVVDPRFILRDFRQKFSSLAADISITLRVPGPPSQAVVSLSTDCDINNAPYIDLDWTDTTDTDNYDIFRDSLILVSGLEQTFYQDLNVGTTTSYSYQVLANGPAGNTLSDSVSITTSDCISITPATCQIISIGGKELATHPEGVRTTDNTPLITGTTNIANAIIQITINPGSIISVTTSANANGYWSWQSPIKLSHDSYTLIVTATDPNNVNNFTSASANFRITEEEEDEEETKKKLPAASVVVSPRIVPPAITPEPEKDKTFINLDLSVKNQEKQVFAGDALNLRLELATNDSIFKNRDHLVYFEIIDSDNQIITGTKEKIDFSKNSIQHTRLTLPTLLENGKYKIVAKTYDGKRLIMAEDYFSVKALPLINLGGGFSITLIQIVRIISWILLWLLLLLLIFLLLLLWEHHLSRQALFHITENILNRKGYFSRKGVSR